MRQALKSTIAFLMCICIVSTSVSATQLVDSMASVKPQEAQGAEKLGGG